MQDATFSQLYPDAQHELKPGEHPGMHRTDTVDYVLILIGEITAILEEQETVLRAGDILVQRGTNHAWANRSGKPARIAFILIDGQR
jgi:quercetin dioxygenase-like cupin family protein